MSDRPIAEKHLTLGALFGSSQGDDYRGNGNGQNNRRDNRRALDYGVGYFAGDAIAIASVAILGTTANSDRQNLCRRFPRRRSRSQEK